MAIGVAKEMLARFGTKLNVRVFTNSSEEAQNYTLKASTSVFIDGEPVPLAIATHSDQMADYLQKALSG